MSLDINTSRAIRTPAERRTLVRAIRDSTPGELELDWVEWKSGVDLREKRWKVEIARQVLGFRNRDPDRAAMNVEGCGYLLIGVEPGNLSGVSPIDSAELEDGVAPYLGRDGPQWNPDLEEVHGVAVLVITVEAPRWGDPIFTLEKELENLRNGEVFVRRPGKTERATAADIRALTARARATRARGLALDLEPEGELSIRPIHLGDEAARWWLEREREGWTQTYRRKYASLGYGRTRIIVNPLFPSPERFQEELDGYLAQAAGEFGIRARLRALELGVGLVRLAIVNLSEDNYSQVEVVLRLPPTISAFFDDADVLEGRELAEPPNLSSSLAFIPRMPHVHIPALQGPVGYVKNLPDAVEIHFPPVNVRPSQKHELDPVTLIADASLAVKELEGRWSATSSSVSGVVEGAFSVAIECDPLTPEELFGPFDA